MTLTHCVLFSQTNHCCPCVSQYSGLPEWFLSLCVSHWVKLLPWCFMFTVAMSSCGGSKLPCCFGRTYIYLSCSFSYCHVACLVDASEGVHPDDKGTRAREKSDYTNDSPSYEWINPCWVSLHAWCGVRHSSKDTIRHGWFTFHCHNRCILLWQPSCTAVALRPWSWLSCAYCTTPINTAAFWANIHMPVILCVLYVLLSTGTVQSK